MVSNEHIVAAQNGDGESLIFILRAVEQQAYKTACYLLGNKQDALDATQEVLIRVSRNIRLYETRAKFETWVGRIVTNICIDEIRRRKETVSIEGAEMLPVADTHVEQQVLRDALIEDVQRAIHSLDEPYRSVVVLRYVNQYAYEEIADTLQLPLNTVKSHLFRAKTRLQTLLSEYAKGG